MPNNGFIIKNSHKRGDLTIIIDIK